VSTIVKNPLFYADLPDIDVLRVDDTFYMVSTTMHMSPGAPILKSKDLKNWEIVSYLFDITSDNAKATLQNGQHMYGQNQWATCLGKHDDYFYAACSCGNIDQTLIFTTDDIEKSNWNVVRINQLMHDPSIVFDGDAPYILSGCGEIRIVELEKDLSGIKEGGVDRILISTQKEGISLRCEGVHAYKKDGYYYLLFIEWPFGSEECAGRRRVVCYRSNELLGEYERKVLFDDNMGYYNKGIAQGALFDTPNGDWYSILFQDHDAVGRIPYLLPVKWEGGWPVIGVDGKTPQVLEVPFDECKTPFIVCDDEFSYEKNELIKQWQWNHNPDNDSWSVTERPGYLRLKTVGLTKSVLNARNTLTQRTVGPKFEATTAIETEGMKDGDYAGIVALQSRFGTVGVKKENGKTFITMTVKDGVGGEFVLEQVETEMPRVYLKIFFDFENSRDIADFYYSKDGENYSLIGASVKMLYTLDHFMGYRIGLFNYATIENGGYVDFDFFRVNVIE